MVIKSQWAKWKELKAHKKPSLDRAVDICARIGASEIMSFKHDWNTEIVAQFYATLYVDSDRVMHWMTAVSVSVLSMQPLLDILDLMRRTLLETRFMMRL